MITSTVSAFLFPALMIIAGFGDTMSYKISNRLTLTIALLFFPLAFLTQMPLAQFGTHLLMGLGLFILGYLLFSFGVFGGGDAKLMAAAGLWLGYFDGMSFLMFTAIAGGVLAVFVGGWSLLTQSWEIHESRMARHLVGIKPKVPYGYAFAVGAILVMPQTWWMTGAFL